MGLICLNELNRYNFLSLISNMLNNDRYYPHYRSSLGHLMIFFEWKRVLWPRNVWIAALERRGIKWTYLKAEFERTIWAAGARLWPLLLPPGSCRPTENKRGDLIFHAGSSWIPGSTCGGWGFSTTCNWASPAVEFRGSTLARGKPKDKGQALQPDLIKTMGRFSLSELLTLLASLSFRTWFRENRSHLLGPCRDFGPWCTNWRPWERVKKESNVGEEHSLRGSGALGRGERVLS